MRREHRGFNEGQNVIPPYSLTDAPNANDAAVAPSRVPHSPRVTLPTVERGKGGSTGWGGSDEGGGGES